MLYIYLSISIVIARAGKYLQTQEETGRVHIDRTVASLTSPHCRCPLAASISPRVQRMREQLATTQAGRRILGSSTELNGFGVNRRRSIVPRRRACSFARPLRFYSASASVASSRQIVTLATCDYPRTERSEVASSRSSWMGGKASLPVADFTVKFAERKRDLNTRRHKLFSIYSNCFEFCKYLFFP